MACICSSRAREAETGRSLWLHGEPAQPHQSQANEKILFKKKKRWAVPEGQKLRLAFVSICTQKHSTFLCIHKYTETNKVQIDDLVIYVYICVYYVLKTYKQNTAYVHSPKSFLMSLGLLIDLDHHKQNRCENFCTSLCVLTGYFVFPG